MKHLYVHIPFCRSRCAYCDFASEPVGPHLRAGRVQGYLDCLRAELRARGASLERPVETIYLGGGTPTVLPRATLLELVTGLAGLQRVAGQPGPASAEPTEEPEDGGEVLAKGEGALLEFTVEANPGTIDDSLLADLDTAGGTRISLGVQSFSPALRSSLGRRTSQEEVEAALRHLRSSGWGEWNIDLVFGMPGQDREQALADVDAAVAAAPTHISLYDLTYTEAYADQVERTKGPGARAAAAAFAEEHYADVVSLLRESGYVRYEVSNFALPGHECRHNQAYWRGEDYLGIGASAVSTVGAERRTNPSGVAGYLAGESPEIEMLSEFTRLWEQAMLGLRTTEGVDESLVGPVLDTSQRDRLLEQGCLQRCCGKLRLNPGFMDVGNGVLAALLLTPDSG